jgi:glycosidase
MVGETFTGDRGLIRSYVDPATMLDGQFDFPLRAQIARNLLMRQGTIYELRDFLDSNDDFYGAGSVMGTFIGNHDLPRAVHLAEDVPQFGEWDSGKSRGWSNQPALPTDPDAFERLFVAYALLFTIPGAPLVYYGDEIAMAGAGDPDNRRPMQWTGLVDDQERLRDGISRLARIRSEHPALRRGDRTTLGGSGDVYTYRMNDGGDEVVVVLNRGDDAEPADGVPAGTWRDLVTDEQVVAPFDVPPRTAVILIAQ